MAKETKITCDGCGEDLTSHVTGHTLFRMQLSCEEIRRDSEIRFDTIPHPPIDEDCYFCSKKCLNKWLTND